jgi:hypothetical protein
MMPRADLLSRLSDRFRSRKNLNQSVWFVHKRLGISGSAFSLDDGIADVGVPDANRVTVAIGNISDPMNSRTLSNILPYGKNSRWGPVMVEARRLNDTRLKLADPTEYWKLGEILAGATVASDGGDVQRGILVQALQQAPQYWVVLNPNKPLRPSTVKHRYKFYDSGVNGPL